MSDPTDYYRKLAEALTPVIFDKTIDRECKIDRIAAVLASEGVVDPAIHHAMAQRCDPAGDTVTIANLREDNGALLIQVKRLGEENEAVKRENQMLHRTNEELQGRGGMSAAEYEERGEAR